MTNREKFKDEPDEMLSVFLAVVKGEPEAYACGATSWSVDDKRTCRWEHLKLAEGNE